MLALADLAAVRALSGVILEQVSQHLRGGQVVDGDDFVALSAEHLTESKTANAAETVNSNLNSHDKYPPKNCRIDARTYETVCPV